MIKRSSFIVAILLIACLSISSVSATAMDNNSNEILDSTGMTTDDINTINDFSVAHNVESEGSAESNNVDQSSIDMTKSSINSVSNLDSESQSSDEENINKENSVSANEDISEESTSTDNIASDSNSVSTSKEVSKSHSVSYVNAKSEDNEKLGADDAKSLDDVSVAHKLESKSGDSDIDSLDDVSVAHKLESKSADDVDSDNSNIKVSNLGSEVQSSNDVTNDKSIVSVSVPYEVNKKGGMADNIGQANIASQDDVSDSVMITSTGAPVAISNSDVKNTEIVSLLTSQSVLTSDSTASYKISLADVIKGAGDLKQYVLKYKKLPKAVRVDGTRYTISIFSYLMSQAILNINSGKTSKITVIKVTNSSTSTSYINKNVTKDTYLKLAKTVANAGVNKKVLPNYVSFDGKKADFKLYTYAFAKILVFDKEYNQLPNLCLFDSSVFKDSPKGNSVSVSDIMDVAVKLKAYTLSNGKLAKSGHVGGKKVNIEQFSYLMAQAIKCLNDNNASAKIDILDVIASDNNGFINHRAFKSTYLSAANKVASDGVNKKVLPSYVSLDGDKAVFKVYTYGFAKILAFYKSEKMLPNYCDFDSSVFKDSPKGNSVSVSDIMDVAVKLKAYTLSNGKLAKSGHVGGKKVNIEQFSYLMAQAIKCLNDNNASAKIDILDVIASDNNGFINHRAFKSTYLSAANKVASDGVNKKVLPSYVSLDGDKAVFKVYTYGFAKILAFYKSEKMLPNYCDFDSSVFKEPKPKYVTVDQIIEASYAVRDCILTNKRLPADVAIANGEVSIGDFSYLLSKAIEKVFDNDTSEKIKVISVSESAYTGNSFITYVNSSEVLRIAKYVDKYCAANGVAPKYVHINGVKSNFDIYTYLLNRYLYVYSTNGKLAKHIYFNSAYVAEPSPNFPIIRGVNEYNTAKDLSIYLKASGHSALNSQIKNLAKSLTQNLRTTLDKANAIFNYVRDRISYSFYYNSRKSASGALSSKSANCCDKSNLVVALCRAANIPARYCHSTSCHFRSGLVCGHVWAQILVGNLWCGADATSTSNSLGHVVNWNTGSLGSLNRYSAIPF